MCRSYLRGVGTGRSVTRHRTRLPVGTLDGFTRFPSDSNGLKPQRHGAIGEFQDVQHTAHERTPRPASGFAKCTDESPACQRWVQAKPLTQIGCRTPQGGIRLSSPNPHSQPRPLGIPTPNGVQRGRWHPVCNRTFGNTVTKSVPPCNRDFSTSHLSETQRGRFSLLSRDCVSKRGNSERLSP